MPRYFTLDQATALLPRVERHLRDALFARNEYREAEDAFAELQIRILMAGGSLVDREKVTRIVAKKAASGTILQHEMTTLEALGVQVKDLEIGLIDFPTWYQGEEVLLCWRFGEDAIRYWHGLTEGYRGRREIDEVFLSGHSSQSEQ